MTTERIFLEARDPNADQLASITPSDFERVDEVLDVNGADGFRHGFAVWKNKDYPTIGSMFTQFALFRDNDRIHWHSLVQVGGRSGASKGDPGWRPWTDTEKMCVLDSTTPECWIFTDWKNGRVTEMAERFSVDAKIYLYTKDGGFDYTGTATTFAEKLVTFECPDGGSLIDFEETWWLEPGTRMLVMNGFGIDPTVLKFPHFHSYVMTKNGFITLMYASLLEPPAESMVM